jgi:ATP-dependent Clp protease adapter protein ClpS
MYKVLVHNDDVTTYFFVVAVLAFIFKIEVSMAEKIAMEAHKNGVALVTILPLEQAELRIDQAHSRAKTAKYPLRFSYEPA